jgi:Cu+-exporting ATPase
LAIGGMSCAACAARIEKRLNQLDGVSATVNYATEKASVVLAGAVTPADLVATVQQMGYAAELPKPPLAIDEPAAAPGEPTALRNRLLVSLVLTLPVVVLSMVPPLQFPNWQWLSLALAGPVVVYGGAPFHRAAWANLRHRAAAMDTLVSMGTLAAFGWSLWALFFGTAGMPGMHHEFTLSVSRGDGVDSIYLEAATGITVFILAGRYFEAPGRSGVAGTARVGSQGRRRAA